MKGKNKKQAGKKTALCAMMIALAMIFSYVEALIPLPFPVPGIKLGIANLIVVLGLYYLSAGEVFLISMIRILLMGYLFGNGMSLLYSLAGGILSFFVMFFLKKTKWFQIPGVSVAGGVCHNIAQIFVAAAVLQSKELFYYLPALLVAGVITGFLIGLLAERILPLINQASESDSL